MMSKHQNFDNKPKIDLKSFNIMWLYHVPFTICVVSVLKIAFCDQKKNLTIFFQASYDF
jgi:hypothetical protein